MDGECFVISVLTVFEECAKWIVPVMSVLYCSRCRWHRLLFINSSSIDMLFSCLFLLVCRVRSGSLLKRRWVCGFFVFTFRNTYFWFCNRKSLVQSNFLNKNFCGGIFSTVITRKIYIFAWFEDCGNIFRAAEFVSSFFIFYWHFLIRISIYFPRIFYWKQTMCSFLF